MFRAKLSICTLAIIFICTFARLHAFDDWQPITAEDLKMTADAAHQGDAIILYHEETSDDMTRHRYVYMRVKILTEKGKSRADVAIPYDAGYVGISDIRARTISPDGTITPFTGKAFNSTIVKAHGVKYLAKTFTLPNVQPGSIVEWKYTEYWEDFVRAPHWVVQDDLFQRRARFSFVPLLKQNEYVEDDRGQTLDRVYYSVVGLPEGTEVKSINNKMELELKDIPAFVEEDFSPPEEVMKWRVNFYYGTGKMGKPQEFWKSEGKFWNKEVDRFAVRSSAVSAAVQQTVSPSDTPEQKARKIYAFVQKIDNLDFTRDERLGKHKWTLDDVLHENKGYRNEIARLFLAMARTANIPVYLMRVSDRDKVFFQPNIPNPSQLTSEIAIVVLDGKEVFLDPGTPMCPFGHLAWQHTSTQGNRQNPDGGTTLVPAPSANYKDAVSKRVGWLTLSEDGSARGKIATAWAGEEALVRRLISLKTDPVGRKKELEDELKAVLPNGTAVQMTTTAGWDTPDSQLTASFTVEIPSYASSAGKRMLVPTNLFESHNRQPFAQGERKNPVYFNFPYYSIDETQVTFPAGFRVENLPQVAPLKTDYSLYQVKHSTTGNTVVTDRDFGMGGIAFKPAEYPELRKFFAGVSTGDSEQLVLSTAK